MSEGHYIALSHHRVMLLDQARMDAYEAAVRAVVRPGDVVVDLGTGTGILALWAVRAGARKVYAIDPAPIIQLAQRLADDNEGGDRIEFIQADARRVSLPEQADVLVSECMGNFFVTDDLAPVLRDAARYLVPGARVVPGRIRLWVAPVFYPMLDDVTFWTSPIHGLDMSGARSYALQTTYVRHVNPALLVAPPVELCAFDILESPDTVEGTVSFTVDKRCTIHGLVGWFDAELSPGVILDTAPGTNTHWAQTVFPVEPISLGAGCRVDARFDLVTDQSYRTRWQWSVEVRDPRDQVVARSRHDTSVRLPPSRIVVTATDRERIGALLQARCTQELDTADTSLMEELDRATVLPSENIPPDIVTMNSRIVLEDQETRARDEIALVYPRDEDPAEGKVSVLSTQGWRMLGKRIGQTVDWQAPCAAPRHLRIVDISYQPESQGHYWL